MVGRIRRLFDILLLVLGGSCPGCLSLGKSDTVADFVCEALALHQRVVVRAGALLSVVGEVELAANVADSSRAFHFVVGEIPS